MGDFNKTGFSHRTKPNDSQGLQAKYETLIQKFTNNSTRSDTFRELTKTHYDTGSDYWRNWNAARPQLAVKIDKLNDLHHDIKNKERNFIQHYEENKGRNFDEDYFVSEIKSEIENLDRWYYNNKHFMGRLRFRRHELIQRKGRLEWRTKSSKTRQK